MKKSKFGYVMTASCTKDDYNVLSINFAGVKASMSTQDVAMLVVILDLVMVSFYWIALMCAK